MFHENQQIGIYTLIKKLGQGGFGEVWLAKNNDEYVAVKLPHKDQIDWKQITQEIGLWTLCGKHPNLMPLVGARNFNGQIAIISEYAPDGSLEDLLKEKGKLSEIEAVEMTIGILEGLQHLHESGIIHRDLKPANILLDGKTPRLTDFGISRIISADSLSETISGTWAYMAPECFDGKRNIQTDVWSVGVILYKMLTGSLPFPQKEQTSLIGAIMMSEPQLLTDAIPLELQNIVSRALSKTSTIRYSKATQMRDELLNFLQTYVSEQTENYDGILNVSETVTHEQIRLIPYRKGNKWGFCDYKKKLIVEAKYDSADFFSEGLAWVELNNKQGFIDKTGNEIIPLKYDYTHSFDEGLAWVKLNNKCGFIDKTGNEIIPLKYDSADSFYKGFSKVELNNKCGFIDKTGKEVIPLKYDARNLNSFNNGLAKVRLNSRWGYIARDETEYFED